MNRAVDLAKKSMYYSKRVAGSMGAANIVFFGLVGYTFVCMYMFLV